MPARRFGTPDLKGIPGVVLADDRPGAPEANVFWAGHFEEAGRSCTATSRLGFLVAPTAGPAGAFGRRAVCGEPALGRVAHVNKGLAGAPADAIAAGRDTAMNPAVLDARAR